MSVQWSVGRSIALELEGVFHLLAAKRREEFPHEVDRLPAEWWTEGEALAGGKRWGWPMGAAAWLAGVLTVDDYRTATLAIRELTVGEAISRLAQALGRPTTGISGDRAAYLVDLAVEWMTASYERHGITQVRPERSVEAIRQQLLAMTRLLKGGDLHSRFWFWLDQGYFLFYQEWREERREYMERQAREVEAQMAHAGLGWLAPQNPVQYYPGLRAAVQNGELQLFCWIEPFDLFDHWFLYPGFLSVAVGHPSEGFAGFRADAEQVATRLKALADPNRLVILRLVRHFAMDNTEMADYLGVSRQTVSVHAQILREAGLIQTRQRGRQASHTVQPGEVERLFHEVMRILDIDPKRP